MNFNISIEQEEEINQWLDEENKIAIENQLNSDSFDEETKQRLRESVELGVETPLHSLEHGYWSVSFTPTAVGSRIYVHHHINGSSAKVQDYDDLRERLESPPEFDDTNAIKISSSDEDEPVLLDMRDVQNVMNSLDDEDSPISHIE